jgi:hypothetical protein
VRISIGSTLAPIGGSVRSSDLRVAAAKLGTNPSLVFDLITCM